MPVRGEKATRPCAKCGKLLTRYLSQARGEKWFCDRACQRPHMPRGANESKEPNRYRGLIEARPCAECGAEVERYLNEKNAERPWFHSMGCRAKWNMRQRKERGTYVQPRKPRRGDTIPCEQCGRLFYRQPAYVEQNRRFHSKACAYKSFQKTRRMVACALDGCSVVTARRPSDTRKYCSRAHGTLATIKRPTGRVHNGRPVILNSQGYYTIYEPTHPKASRSGHVLEHRWIVEQSLGRVLDTREQVDHKNQDKLDNRLDNLQILDPTHHTWKTAADRKRRELSMAERLVQYERLFGALPEAQS